MSLLFWLWYYKTDIHNWHESTIVKASMGVISDNSVVTSTLSPNSFSLHNSIHSMAFTPHPRWTGVSRLEGYGGQMESLLWNTKHLILVLKYGRDLGIYRWEVIENSLGYIKTQKKKKRHFIENMFKNLSTNKKQADTAPFYLRHLELVMQANLSLL